MSAQTDREKALKRYEQLVNSNCKLRRNIHDAQCKLQHNQDEMSTLRRLISE